MMIANLGLDYSNGKRALFWEASRLNGMRPRDIAPLIIERSKKMKCLVRKALDNDSWVAQINIQGGLSLEHIVQFSKLWEMLDSVHTDPNTTNMI
jgi:hypothetical protein